MEILSAAEVMRPFTDVGALVAADKVLIQSTQGGVQVPARVPIGVLGAWLAAKSAISVGDDGYLYIGGEKTNVSVGVSTPLFRRGREGVEVNTDSGATWTVVAYFSDVGVDAPPSYDVNVEGTRLVING